MSTAPAPAVSTDDLAEWLTGHLAGVTHLQLADALVRVLQLHIARTLRAQVMHRGRCYWCDGRGRTGGRLLRTWREPGARGGSYEMHEHLDPWPACPRCGEEDDTGPWPCATVAAITTALDIPYPLNQE
jgi:hypothetical protein